MGFQLQNNNTLIISARIYAEVHAKTWIWKGIDFGYLGCLKTTACNGDIVTYSVEMDLELELQITIFEFHVANTIAQHPRSTPSLPPA